MTLRHDHETPYPSPAQFDEAFARTHRWRAVQIAQAFWIACDLCGATSPPGADAREALRQAWAQGFVVAGPEHVGALTPDVKEALEATPSTGLGPYGDPRGVRVRPPLHHLCPVCVVALTPLPRVLPVAVRGTVAVTASSDGIANLLAAVRAASPQAVDARRLRDLEHLVRLVAADTPPPAGTAERLGGLLLELLAPVPSAEPA